ncbi:MAG: hypothetical protein AMS20_04410 [Gemmatimonas sp. SG8_28]|jgi:glycosyltransferase involved in cell wall biosynthesis|nr:MAG: hypothetical protein AMS20_04410 [Gemmatimonas sp. SG8_28]
MAATDAPMIAYVLRKFPVLSETFVLNEMLALEAAGVRLHVFSLLRPNDPRFHENLPKLKANVSFVPDLTDIRKLLRHHGRLWARKPRSYTRTALYAVGRGRGSLLWRFVQAGYIANEVSRLRIRHLHAHFAHDPTTVALLASGLSGVPFSFTAHAVDIYKAGVSRRLLAGKIDAARFVVTVSDFNKRYLGNVAPRAADKVVRIYNGIDLERFAPNGTMPQAPFRIVTVARLVEKKGLLVLVEACRLLRDRGVPFACDIIGKGIMRPVIERRIKEAGLRKHVRLLGPRTQDEVRERYHASHLYVLPCIVAANGNRDGLPVSLVEALASGLPVVTTPVTGIPEVVRDRHNGLLVPSGDPAALADAIESLVGDAELYGRLARTARASVARAFDQRETVTALRSLLAGAAA